MTTPRKKIPVADRWHVEALYSSLAAWERDLRHVTFKPLLAYKGKLRKRLKPALDAFFATERHLRKLYTYAHLRHDEDLADDTCKSAYQRITALYHTFAEEMSWLTPEILTLPKQTLMAPALKSYRFFLEQIVRLKAHTLPAEQEALLALAGKPLDAAHNAFSAINDVDLKFGTVTDRRGISHPLTHASYSLYLRSPDRTLRQHAFEKIQGQYAAYENTIAELLRGQVERNVFEAKARKYPSALDAALFPKQIDTAVYHSLIRAVHRQIDALHDYLALRKRALKLKALQAYDLYVPFVAHSPRTYTYDQAVKLTVESVAPLGEAYQQQLRLGLTSNRWVDRYENRSKRSGAYSSGCYDSMPYILMNFKGTARDLSTLAHEAGHSMHSLLARRNQPYPYADYVIFVAEVASTFNEELLCKTLLDHAQSKKERAAIINDKLEDLRATLFRQAMFAEFELWLHESAEKGIPLTPKLLREKYAALNRFYFGKHVVVDENLAIEWARIPHFYYGYYVYQYATGISAAIALSQAVLCGNAKARDGYLQFLSSGGSDYPLNLLERAGVNMRTEAPVTAAIRTFRALTEELDGLL